MGLFDNLFGKTENKDNSRKTEFDASKLVKSSAMMDEDQFWKLVDQSLKMSEGEEEQLEYLIAELQKLSPEAIIAFRLRTDKLLYDTYTSAMWCAAYIINGGCSDDGFEYFRLWVISRGKEVYYQAKENPDSLVNVVDAGREDYDLESFWSVALEAFNNKTGKDLYDYIDYENFKTAEGNYPQFEFDWEEDKPETMRKICPRLFERLYK